MKVLGNILRGIGIFLFLIMFIATLAAFNVRNVSKEYLSKENIKKIINDVDISLMFKNENGTYIAEVSDVVDELKEAGIPEEYIDSILNCGALKSFTGEITGNVINYAINDTNVVVLNEITDNEFKDFIDDNIDKVLDEINNGEGKDILSKKEVKKLKNELYEAGEPMLKEVNSNIKDLNDSLSKSIMENDDIKNSIELVRFFYSNTLTTIFIIVFIVICLIITLLTWSWYKEFKYLGIGFIVNSIILGIIQIPVLVSKGVINSGYPIVDSFISSLISNAGKVFVKPTIISLIIGIVLIVLNIIIHFIYKKKNA